MGDLEGRDLQQSVVQEVLAKNGPLSYTDWAWIRARPIKATTRIFVLIIK